MRGKYEVLRTELESIYYADYVIDRLYKKIELKALNMSVEKWYDYTMKSVEKLCRFQIIYYKNYKLLYEDKNKDVIIKCVIKGKRPSDNERCIISKFYNKWEKQKVGL